MLMIVTFLILFVRLPHKISSSHTCVPNSHIFLNGKLCHCDSFGSWRTSDCYSVGRQQKCQPGHVAIQGCVRCICQENGQYSCVEQGCISGQPSVNENLAKGLPWCNPFRTYYIDCNICVCPASRKPLEARCAVDVSCTLPQEPSTDEISARTVKCIPTVMYLFHCLHCLCPDDGHFDFEKCVERCERKQSLSSRSCVPDTIYKKGCNVCVCPYNGVEDDSRCTNTPCKNITTKNILRKYKKKVAKCNPHEFLKPKCVYCDCNNDGKIDKDTCIELECLDTDVAVNDSCSSGETFQFCEECLCTRTGITTDEYCTKKCSNDSKLELIKTIVALPDHDFIIDKVAINIINGSRICKPNTIYIDGNEMCICPANGNTSLKLCAEIETQNKELKLNKMDKIVSKIKYNGTCEPSTFVEFGCNSCYCSKKGVIDPKWCTFDDCEAKRAIAESHTLHPEQPAVTLLNITCTPGSILTKECNFCICPMSGLTEEKVCTKIECSSLTNQPTTDRNFTCEPLTYYEVGCNVCFCAKDGIKNVAKCTKNVCENTFLRTELCAPGQLFNDECNVCVCPPNGNKSHKLCTNNICSKGSAPWKKIFHLSESLLGNHIDEYDASPRNLDLCYPGEEFIDGCMICVCPDVGLKIYAECSPDFCEEKKNSFQHDHEIIGTDRDKSNLIRKSGTTQYRKRNTTKEACMTPKFNGVSSRNHCTPNSTYIVRCRECICPQLGDVAYFCRPLPDNFKCEQAFSYHIATENKMPSNNSEEIVTTLKVGGLTFVANSTNTQFNIPPMEILHDHTTYKCNKVANITDACFQCECNGTRLIYQHCFQSNAKHCDGVTPSFLLDDMNLTSSKYDFT